MTVPPAPIISTDVNAAAECLRAGGLVAFATETVYGLGADAANAAAVSALYRLKQRPSAHPVIVHLADFNAAGEWARDIPLAAKQLAQHFMPGPLTLLLPRQAHLQHLAGGDLIALRLPAHPLAQQLLRAFGGGVVAPSANRFGAVSPTCARHVADEFADLSDLLILDGGDCSVGIESTIVGFTGEDVFIVRPGNISAAQIRAIGITLTTAPTDISAPGTLARHYAPRTPLLLMPPQAIEAYLHAHPQTICGVLSPHQPTGAANMAVWQQAADNATQYAHELYRHLRTLDSAAISQMIIATPPATEEWAAIHDRLKRAASVG